MVRKTVFVLGAGASADAGGPLMRDFFPAEEGPLKTIHDKYFLSNSRFLTLERAYRLWSEDEKIPGIESFFNHLEFQSLIGMSTDLGPPYGKVKASLLHRYLVWYVSAYIRNSIAYKRNPPKQYEMFVRGIDHPRNTTIISFNYDQVFDKEILKQFGGLDYFFASPPKRKAWFQQKGSLLFLKLHGSLNWIWCPKCESIDVYDEPIAHKYPRHRCTKKCGELKEPLIIPPNLSKSLYLDPLEGIWSKAYRQLINAEKIVIIGYSLPLIDTAARELLVSGIQNAKEFEIILPNRVSLKSLEDKLGRDSDIKEPLNFKSYVSEFMK